MNNKYLTILMILGIVLFKNMTSTKAAYIPTNSEVRVYNVETAILQEVKIWTGTITPSTATGQTINISSAGFSTVFCAHVMPEYSDNQIWCTMTGMNSSQLTINLYEPSTNLITLLGASVLSGAPIVAADDLENINLHVTVLGY